MPDTPSRKMTRRAFTATGLTASLAVTPAFSMVVESIYEVTGDSGPKAPPRLVKRNVSSFMTRTWEPYFPESSQRRDPCRYAESRTALLVRGWPDLPAFPDKCSGFTRAYAVGANTDRAQEGRA